MAVLPNDPQGTERLQLIAEGAALSLFDAVKEFLEVADEQLAPHTRPPQAHGGCYLGRFRFERLRAAFNADPRNQ